jgi:allophanate hydrolase subunit 2
MIEILTSGLTNSVQDLGRPGYLDQGIGRGGAMDRPALRIANLVLGNPEGAAAVEVAVFPFRLRFLEPAHYAVTGAGCRASLNGKALPPWWSGPADAGDELRLDPPREGARAYVAVGGGIDVPEVLRSRATDLKSVFGGMEGRALVRGDRLATGSLFSPWGEVPSGSEAMRGSQTGAARNPSSGLRPPPGRATGLARPSDPQGEKREFVAPSSQSIDPYHFRDSLGGIAGGEPLALRIMPGAEFEAFTDEAQQVLPGREFTVTADNNRQGMRLEGPLLALTKKLELLSHGIMPGTIQVPPSGQAVIQLAEANTCGGYPKIGHVIEPDLWKLGQAPSGARIRFELISRDAAVAAIRDEELRMKRLANLLGGRAARKAD